MTQPDPDRALTEDEKLQQVIDAHLAPNYAELCVTTNFTFLTGASHPEELMKRAAELYTRFGFEYLDTHWGATGHHNRCTIRLAGDLTRLADKLTGVDAGHQTVEKPLATKP